MFFFDVFWLGRDGWFFAGRSRNPIFTYGRNSAFSLAPGFMTIGTINLIFDLGLDTLTELWANTEPMSELASMELALEAQKAARKPVRSKRR